MKCTEIFETSKTGTDDYHTESSLAPSVAAFIESEGIAYWDDIYAFIEDNVTLTPADWAPVSGNTPRWKKVAYNLHAHRTLEGGKFGDIVRIPGGFATRDAADELDIEIIPDNSSRKRNPGNQDPIYIRSQAGHVVGKAHEEMGKPKMKDSAYARSEIINMMLANPNAGIPEHIEMAKEIIAQDPVDPNKDSKKKKKGR